jgi:hypothetical protein
MTALETAIVVQSAAANAAVKRTLAAPLLSAQFLIDCTPVILPLLDLNLYNSGRGGCNGGMPHQVYEVRGPTDDFLDCVSLPDP